MNELEIFNNQEFGSIRAMPIDGEPWFVGKDVAERLGYQNGSRDVSRHTDEDDRRKMMFFDGSQNRETIFINESGLYSLILSSKLPNAKTFKHWVTSEVIPSIRKYSTYMSPEVIEKILTNPDTIIRLATDLKLEREKRLEFQKKVELMEPKAEYYDNVLQSPNLISITEIAKEFGMNARQMNNFLADHHVQYRINGTWAPYEEYANSGYMKYKTFYNDVNGENQSKLHAYWTQAGRAFIHKLCKENGIRLASSRRKKGTKNDF